SDLGSEFGFVGGAIVALGRAARRKIGEEHLLAFDQREAFRRRHDLREGLVKIKVLLACLQVLDRVPQRHHTHVGGRCRGLCAKNDERAKPALLMRMRNRIPQSGKKRIELVWKDLELRYT